MPAARGVISIRQFAVRLGTTHVAVLRAIRNGRIARGVKDGAIVDWELAEQDWLANIDRSKAPPAARENADRQRERRAVKETEPGEDPLSLSEASAKEKYWKAQMAELKFKAAAKELVLAADVQRKMESVFFACKTKLLALASRARQRLPHLTVDDVSAVDELVREALEDLATGEL
jgi:phage terminase Nu1 subunit (DNA packaging protein)